jgi:hypothetical protein
MSAKVHNTALQHGYQIHRHTVISDRQGNQCAVEQGMNVDKRYASRYHRLGEGVRSSVNGPHVGICCDQRSEVLNMAAHESAPVRTPSVTLAGETPARLVKELQPL